MRTEPKARITRVGTVAADEDGVIVAHWGFDASESYAPGLDYTGPGYLVCGWSIPELVALEQEARYWPDEPLGSTPWTEPQKWLGFFFGALLVVIIAGELIG